MRNFVLMTALPPTLGHMDLIAFAAKLGGPVTVIVNTQPDEPFYVQRYQAIREAVKRIPGGPQVTVEQYHKTLPQEPAESPGFWDMWGSILSKYGFQPGDRIVASELYGVRLAEEVNGQFYPYDLDRWVRWTKATEVRKDWLGQWDQIIPEFRKFLQKKITLFGAESTGKTTMTKALQEHYGDNSNKIFEWARPYLETVGPELTTAKMNAIAEGQYALQHNAYETAVKPLLFQDTDLFSTLGYWRNWSPGTIYKNLDRMAQETRSDLYIMPQANIPFEHDILRYGGDERELSDQFWIDILDEFSLDYVVLSASARDKRMEQAIAWIDPMLNGNPLEYTRRGAEYQT